MIGLACGILNGGKNIFPLQEWVVGEDLFVRSSSRQQIEDVRDAHAKTADARASAALALFNRDPLQSFDAHWFRVYAIFWMISTRRMGAPMHRGDFAKGPV